MASNCCFKWCFACVVAGLVRCSDSPCYNNAKCEDLSDSEDEPSVKCKCSALNGGRYCEGKYNRVLIWPTFYSETLPEVEGERVACACVRACVRA